MWHNDPTETARPREYEMSDCKCDMRTKLVGDGCHVCNPKLAADIGDDDVADIGDDDVSVFDTESAARAWAAGTWYPDHK